PRRVRVHRPQRVRLRDAGDRRLRRDDLRLAGEDADGGAGRRRRRVPRDVDDAEAADGVDVPELWPTAGVVVGEGVVAVAEVDVHALVGAGGAVESARVDLGVAVGVAVVRGAGPAEGEGGGLEAVVAVGPVRHVPVDEVPRGALEAGVRLYVFLARAAVHPLGVFHAPGAGQWRRDHPDIVVGVVGVADVPELEGQAGDREVAEGVDAERALLGEPHLEVVRRGRLDVAV